MSNNLTDTTPTVKRYGCAREQRQKAKIETKQRRAR